MANCICCKKKIAIKDLFEFENNNWTINIFISWLYKKKDISVIIFLIFKKYFFN